MKVRLMGKRRRVRVVVGKRADTCWPRVPLRKRAMRWLEEAREKR